MLADGNGKPSANTRQNLKNHRKQAPEKHNDL